MHEMMETKADELARYLRYDIAMRHYELRMGGYSDAEAVTLLLQAAAQLLPRGPSALASLTPGWPTSEPHQTRIAELARSLRSEMAMRHYDLRMSGHNDEQAAQLILFAIKRLLPESNASAA